MSAATSHDGIFPQPSPARSSASLICMSPARQVVGESTSKSWPALSALASSTTICRCRAAASSSEPRAFFFASIASGCAAAATATIDSGIRNSRAMRSSSCEKAEIAMSQRPLCSASTGAPIEPYSMRIAMPGCTA